MKGYDFSTFENVEIGSFTADDSDGTSGVGRLGTVLERLGTVLGRPEPSPIVPLNEPAFMSVSGIKTASDDEMARMDIEVPEVEEKRTVIKFGFCG